MYGVLYQEIYLFYWWTEWAKSPTAWNIHITWNLELHIEDIHSNYLSNAAQAYDKPKKESFAHEGEVLLNFEQVHSLLDIDSLCVKCYKLARQRSSLCNLVLLQWGIPLKRHSYLNRRSLQTFSVSSFGVFSISYSSLSFLFAISKILEDSNSIRRVCNFPYFRIN